MNRELTEMIGRQAADEAQAKYPSVQIECRFTPVFNDDDASLVEIRVSAQDGGLEKQYTYGTISHEKYPNDAGLQAVLTTFCEQCARDLLSLQNDRL